MLSHNEAQELHRIIGSAITDLSCMTGTAPTDAVRKEIGPALDRALELAALVVADTEPSPVSYDPCITGKVEIDGQTSEFLLPLDNDSVKYSQWGAYKPVLWARTDLLENMADAAREWYIDNREEDSDE